MRGPASHVKFPVELMVSTWIRGEEGVKDGGARVKGRGSAGRTEVAGAGSGRCKGRT